MFLHIGKDEIINSKEIIGIFDIETATVSEYTRDFLKESEKNLKTVSMCDNLPKTVILCDNELTSTVYITQISPKVTLSRLNEELKF